MPERRGMADGHLPDGAAEYRRRLEQAKYPREALESLNRYQPRPGLEGRAELDHFLIEGVPKTAEAVTVVRGLLARNTSNEEKIGLIRILGDLYTKDNSTGANSTIVSDLRAFAEGPVADVATSAVMVMSRFGYLPGSDLMLARAYARGLLEADDYFGEMAHMVDSSPAPVQRQYLEQIAAARNGYAVGVIGLHINSGAFGLERMDAAMVADVDHVLTANEPTFSTGVGAFSLSEVVEYTAWLHALAKVRQRQSGQPEEAFVIQVLSSPTTDPRKILGYLLTPEGKDVLASARVGAPAAGLVSSALKYADQFPSNETIRSAASEIRERAGQPVQ